MAQGQPRLRRSLDEALDEGTDVLEDEVMRRARDGVDEPRFYEGEVCGYVRKYSDTLAIFLLKARRPEKCGDKAEHNVSDNLTITWLPPS
jgi:hypothetical protein